MCPIHDADCIFPAKHKSSLEVGELPNSLLLAVRQFFVANAIRDLRTEGPTHRSMLVNVSRFTAVQDQVANILDLYVRAMQQEVRSYSQLPESRPCKVPLSPSCKAPGTKISVILNFSGAMFSALCLPAHYLSLSGRSTKELAPGALTTQSIRKAAFVLWR